MVTGGKGAGGVLPSVSKLSGKLEFLPRVSMSVRRSILLNTWTCDELYFEESLKDVVCLGNFHSHFIRAGPWFISLFPKPVLK